MIIQEPFLDTMILTRSDSGFKIRQVESNIVYDEAIDLMPVPYTYEETEEKVEILEEEF